MTQQYVQASQYILSSLVIGAAGLVLWAMSPSRTLRFLGKDLEAAWSGRRRFWTVTLLLLAGLVYMIVPLVKYTSEANWSHFFRDGPDLFGDAWAVGLERVFPAQAGRFLLPTLLGLLCIKLFEKWINGRTSEAERAIGSAGLRAWITWPNVLVAIGLSACVCAALDASFWGSLLLCMLAICAFPVVRTFLSSDQSAMEPSNDLSPERERVLRLLEEGKVTGDEAAELLSALSSTIAPVAAPFTASRKLMLAGTAVVLVGFFMPWFSFNPAQEVQRMTGMLNEQMRTMMSRPEFGGQVNVMPNTNMVTFTGPTVTIRGGDVQNGLGWLTLILGLSAGLIPYIATGLPRDTQRHAMRIATAGGLIIVVYLFTTGFRMLSFGLPVVMVGFLIHAAGLLQEVKPKRVAATAPVSTGSTQLA